MDILEHAVDAAHGEFAQARCARDAYASILAIEDLQRQYLTAQALANIRCSIDTRNTFYRREQDFFDAVHPRFARLDHAFNQLLLASPQRDGLEKLIGTHRFTLARLQSKTFCSEIMEDLAEENRLTSAYETLLASAHILFRGHHYTLAQLSPFMEHTDRNTRRDAHEAYYHFFAQHESELDTLYDTLVRVRTRIARTLGYDNYIQLGYDRLLRSDYDMQDIARYRTYILRYAVPLAAELHEQQRSRLGLSELLFYDEPLYFPSGNPVPQGDAPWILNQAACMYRELSPETDQFFTFMREYHLFDVCARIAKASGGYCTTLSTYRAPFIFANFNRTAHDVEVMTHEVGHAFQAYQRYRARLDPCLEAYVWPTYEACEIHSMSMEFLTWPWMGLFFGEQKERFYLRHLTQAVELLPYGAAVDEFQHWVYAHADASATERKKAWRALETQYLPRRRYGGQHYLSCGGLWMRQSHIFCIPFYYIDYTLAQICALQFWDRSRVAYTHLSTLTGAAPYASTTPTAYAEAWHDYCVLCSRGGSEPFMRLLATANLHKPFEEDTFVSTLASCRAYFRTVGDRLS
nr:M3 family oligoendopeptidase [Treponema paraluiscuniculi]